MSATLAIKFDTFPYTQYGMAHGVVRIISSDSFNAQDEAKNPSGSVPIPSPGASGGANSAVWYRARVTLDEINLHDTPAWVSTSSPACRSPRISWSASGR